MIDIRHTGKFCDCGGEVIIETVEIESCLSYKMVSRKVSIHCEKCHQKYIFIVNFENKTVILKERK